MTTINNLTKHDFKVGDLVVYHSLPHKRLFKVRSKGGDSIVIYECWDEAGARCFAENSPYVDIRHATPEEIKAGHRIDDTTDHVTDIRNHVSPSTKVIDHE